MAISETLALLVSMVFQLFLIIDPIAALPVFITITKDNTRKQRRHMVQKAVVVALLVLVFFALIGNVLLSYFHISSAAVKIAGGILLFGIGIEMLYGRVTRTETTEHEEKEAIEKPDVSITPLAIPLLAGPGAITLVMLYSHIDNGGRLLTIAALIIVMVASFIVLRASEHLVKVLGNIGIKVIGRVMGLLLTFVSAQLVLDGLRAAGAI
jgi:multiple antibiotic resistance protein